MESWDDALRELQAYYVPESLAKLAEVDHLLERLTVSGSDRDALRELSHRFHAFAGSGATYGYPHVSALGSDGERTCQVLVDSAKPAGPAEIEHWRALARQLRGEFPRCASGDAPPVSAPRPH